MTEIEYRIHTYYGSWYIKGTNIHHREDGPAVIWKNGGEWWCINNTFHRLDGPARSWPNGKQQWWIDGEEITDDVRKWIAENDLPPWKEWDGAIKIHFALTFR